jgi:hypothetical protein
MQPFSWQHGEQHISKRNYEITVVQGIHSYRLKLEMKSLEFGIFGIWDCGLVTRGNSFWDHVIQISIRQMNFSIYFPNYEK